MLKIIEDKRAKRQRKLFQNETQSKKTLLPSKDLNIYIIEIQIFLLTTIFLSLIVNEIYLKSKKSKINRYVNQIINPLFFLDTSLKTYKEEVLDKDILCLYLVVNIIIIIIKVISHYEKIKITQLINNSFYKDENESQNNNNGNNRIGDKNKEKNKIIMNISYFRNNIISLKFVILIKLFI